jgi:hypothetical protein
MLERDTHKGQFSRRGCPRLRALGTRKAALPHAIVPI